MTPDATEAQSAREQHTTYKGRALREIVAERDAYAEALEKIAEVCNGYGLEAGWACEHARDALRRFRK